VSLPGDAGGLIGSPVLGDNVARDAQSADVSVFSPTPSAPTLMPGESAGFQSISPSLDSFNTESSFQTDFGSRWDASLDTGASDASGTRAGVGAGSSIGGDAGFGITDEAEKGIRTTTLPW
jgi:hypothetical protein